MANHVTKQSNKHKQSLNVWTPIFSICHQPLNYDHADIRQDEEVKIFSLLVLPVL